jgi:type III restriction enzyme
MQPKDYQLKCIEQVRRYLEALSAKKIAYDKIRAIDPTMAGDFAQAIWTDVTGRMNYAPKKNGLGEPLPNFCLKVPTGGGKTFLACHTIDQINQHYLKRKSGFVLWIVPTTQIYRQTLLSLKDRAHSYRQVLDLSSGGRTQILEKGDHFTPQDVQEKLCVMLLMLPSANRVLKETLKIFQDAGGFEAFFPNEDDMKANEELLRRFPNLDAFGKPGQAFGRQVKTSLGNTLRVLQPIVILDEGQKAYSEGAQNTINGFNPCMVVELSATPPPAANKLVEITGMELNREQMIKLDIHVTNKTSANWKDTLMSSVRKQQELEAHARDHEANSGVYIRPIVLVQVERTGKEQRGSGFIHAEDAKAYLLEECGIPPQHVAIKSSEKDDIEGMDLYARDVEVRYIITKQALQEGWDCSFAYVLTILTNPSSKNALTQLVGRILRQPNARKTKVKALDECYVYCFQQNAGGLMNAIRAGLQGEGLGDIAGRVAENTDDVVHEPQEDYGYRKQFKKFEGTIYLPHFIIQEGGTWRELRYEMDLASRIDWSTADVSSIAKLHLEALESKDEHTAFKLSSDPAQMVEKQKSERLEGGGLTVDLLFITRHILDVVPNPWVAYKVAREAIESLRKNNSEPLIAANLVYIVEELVKVLQAQKDTQAEQVFKQLIADKKVCFFLQKGTGFEVPKSIRVTKSNVLINARKGELLQKSLFEKVDKDDMNTLEESVALCLDEQDKLLWWYRNTVPSGYFVQGWQRNKVYADFVTAKKKADDPTDYGSVMVLETKGLHLKNEDTKYKQSIFEICNTFGKQTPWGELELEFSQKEVEFQVIFEDEWKQRVLEEFR